MSILSSTRSGFYSSLTKEYLLSHGYVQMESQTFRDRYFYRHNLYSKHYIKTLCEEYDIDYQVEFTKPSEGGGGTVSSFFATRGMDCIDIAIPVLANMISMKHIDYIKYF